MNVKGFILEDEQGREYVMLCQQLPGQAGKTFELRGWQRLRLVPLQYSEWAQRHIVAKVLRALEDLFKNLPRGVEHSDRLSAQTAISATPALRRTSVLRKVSSVADVPVLEKVP